MAGLKLLCMLTKKLHYFEQLITTVRLVVAGDRPYIITAGFGEKECPDILSSFPWKHLIVLHTARAKEAVEIPPVLKHFVGPKEAVTCFR